MKAILMAFAGMLGLVAISAAASASEMTSTSGAAVERLVLHDCEAVSPGKARHSRHDCHERLKFKGQEIEGHCMKLHHYDGECDDKESADVHDEEDIVCLGEMGFHMVAGVHGAEAGDVDQWQLVKIAEGAGLSSGGGDFAGGLGLWGKQLEGFSRGSSGGAEPPAVREGPSLIPAPTPIPEPVTAGLVGAGILGIVLKRRARRR